MLLHWQVFLRNWEQFLHSILLSLNRMLIGGHWFTEYPNQFHRKAPFLLQGSPGQINCACYVPHQASIISAPQLGLVTQMHLAIITGAREQGGEGTKVKWRGGHTKEERNAERQKEWRHVSNRQRHFSHFLLTLLFSIWQGLLIKSWYMRCNKAVCDGREGEQMAPAQHNMADRLLTLDVRPLWARLTFTCCFSTFFILPLTVEQVLCS